MEAHLAWRTLQYMRKNKTKPTLLPYNNQLPLVSIQLPLYNEQYVAERLIDAVANIHYPKHLLQIQILDDSTDATLQISQQKVAQLKEQGFNIILQHRTNRQGFKAGALQQALQSATGQYIAIFDADFIPPRNFLLYTLAPFANQPKLGMVQTRWAHINENYSLFTKIQALFIDAHFLVEQVGRSSSGYFMNFNGTAGTWRKTTIIDAGGWQGDTLTEDLDLSYRAQLRGWHFTYLPQITAPAELPPDIIGFKAQQFRWIKGGAETAAKILPKIYNTPLAPQQKIHATIHLLSSSVYIPIFLMLILSVPSLLILNKGWAVQFNYQAWSIFFFSANIFVWFMYIVTLLYRNTMRQQVQPTLSLLAEIIYLLPLFLALTLGLSLHNAIAAIRGWSGQKTPFVRTPKYKLQKKNTANSFAQKVYFNRQLPKLAFVEMGLALYFLLTVCYIIQHKIWLALPFYLMATFGFATVSYYAIKHTSIKAK